VDGAFETNADPALVELFRAESDTHIPALSQGLLALEKGQADDQTIASMMRAAHSIKGAARIVGIQAAIRVSHIMEDCFTAAKDNRSILSSDAVDVLLRGVDGLQRICTLRPDAEMTEAWLESLLGQLAGIKEGRAPEAPVKQSAHPQAEIVQVAARPRPESVESVALPAEFDDAAADALRGRLRDVLREGAGKIRLDFRQVRHVSVRALSLLASMAREAGRMDPAPTLQTSGVPGPVAALLRVSGLDRTLTEVREHVA
jgi:chemotaxis protein histidine kinase CheA